MAEVCRGYGAGVDRIDLSAIAAIADGLFAPQAAHGLTLALVVMHRGEFVFERYGVQPDTPFSAGGPVTADTTLISWSMAKSITHAAVGALVAAGRLHVDAPAPVPSWRGTPKEAITLQHLLEMRPGLQWVEDYVDDSISHCIEMLYGDSSADMAAYAAGLPLIHAPGDVFNYSSGTTNILSRIVGDIVGGGREGMEEFLRDRVFAPAGMTSAIPKFDDAGTFVGSSYVYATARDFARFGDWYRTALDGGSPTLPTAWAEHARTFSAHDEPFDYGRHWWLWRDLPGTFGCHGYEGQYTVVVPDRELVLVHLGKSPDGLREPVWTALRGLRDAISPRSSAINRG
jgi:CubicO group peptidase (beta-lactamase class C family)